MEIRNGENCGHRAVTHGDHVDPVDPVVPVDHVHDGHRHAAHEGQWDGR